VLLAGDQLALFGDDSTLGGSESPGEAVDAFAAADESLELAVAEAELVV